MTIDLCLAFAKGIIVPLEGPRHHIVIKRNFPLNTYF